MITIYRKGRLPKGQKAERFNDIFFNSITVEKLDSRAAQLIAAIDRSELVGKYRIRSRFDGAELNIDRLSTGCKTVLNVLYNPDRIFDIRECGENALDLLYTLPQGRVTCDYPMISFAMTGAMVCEGGKCREITSYEELKEWWNGES